MENKTNVWGLLSPIYIGHHEHNVKQFADILRNMLRLPIQDRQVAILDAGCGTGGAVALELKSSLRCPAKIVGVDDAEEMIAIAQKRLAEVNSKGVNPDLEVEFLKGNLQDLSTMKDDAFDYYVSNFVYNYLPDPSLAIKEAYRVLKKNGEIGISILGRGKETIENNEMELSLQEVGVDSAYIEKTRVFDKIDQTSLRKLLEDNGFEVRYCWYQQMPWNRRSQEDSAINYIRLAGLHKDQKEAVIKKHNERLAVYEKKGMPLMLDALYIIANKKAE